MALLWHRDAFFLLIIFGLFTDLVDGPIARWLGQTSRLGAKLDTLADAGTLLAGILGLYIFAWPFLQPETPWLCLFFASYGLAALACLMKFRELPAYHLYLSKTAALGSGVFFTWFYLAGYARPLFLIVLGIGVAANLESLLVTLRLRRFRPDIASLLRLVRSERETDN